MPIGDSVYGEHGRLGGTAGGDSVLRHAPVLLLGGLFLFTVGLKAARTPLWFDEILTYHVASLSGPGTIIKALLTKAENHPPLDYILRHYAMAAFGGSELAFRLPSVLAALIASACLYLIVLRRTSVLPALVAFSFPFVTYMLKHFYEGRPYATLLASMCLAFLAWQLAAEKQSGPRLVFLALCLSLGPHLHYYGVLNYVPIAVGEAWRCWERRKISWPIVACFAVSFAVLAPLVPFAIHSRDFSAHFWTPLGPSMIAHMLVKIFSPTLPAAIVALIGCAVAVLFIGGGPGRRADEHAIPRHEVAAALMLAIVPLTTYVLAVLVTRAYTDKYLINSVAGVALVLAYLTGRLQAWRPGCALIIAASIGLMSVVTLGYLARYVPARTYNIAAEERRLIEATEHPVLIPDANHFMQIHFYLPQILRDKIYTIADRKLAIEYIGHDTNELVFDRLRPYIPMNAVTLCAFTTQHSQFLMVLVSPSWIVRRLLADGAESRVHEKSMKEAEVLSVAINGRSGC